MIIKRISNTLANWWNSIKMHSKLFIVYIIIAVIPLTVVSIILVIRADSVLERQVERNYISANQQVANNIQNKLDSYIDIADALYFNPQLNSLLHKKNQYTIDHKLVHDEIDIIVGSQLGQRDDVHALLFYLDNKYLYEGGYIRYIDEEFEDSEIYTSIKSAGIEGVWMPTIFLDDNKLYLDQLHAPNKDSGRYSVYAYFREMNYIDRDITIIMSMSLSEKELYNFMNEQSNSWQTYIVDNNGNIISTTERKKIGKNILENENDSIFIPVFDLNTSSGLYDWNNEKGEQFKVFHEALSNDWQVISVVPLAQILNEKREMIKFVVIMISLTVFVAALLLTWIASLITKRIDVLIYKMENITPGEDNNLLMDISGNDEIATIDRNFNKMHKRINQLIKQMYALEVEKRETELEALQANINPHFLYNCLSTVNWMTFRSKPEEIREVLGNIAKFYRLSINNGHEIVTIEQEIEHVKAYSEIVKYQTGGKFNIYYCIEDEAKNQLLPKLILQPIIENSIKHGMGDVNRITVIIRIERKEKEVHITVMDDGIGIEGGIEKIDELMKIEHKKNEKYGVRNIDQRIKLFFGDDYGLAMKPGKENGIVTTIHIPYNTIIDEAMNK